MATTEAAPSNDDPSRRQWLIETTQQVHDLQRLVKEKDPRFGLQNPVIQNEVAAVMAISLAPGQLIDADRVSPGTIEFIRSVAPALQHLAIREAALSQTPIGVSEGQAELFRHFAQVFAAVAGCSYDAFASEDQLHAAVKSRLEHKRGAIQGALDKAMDEMGSFYKAYSTQLWAHARDLGGLKLMIGGKRAFTQSAFGGVRKMALYVDTQLIADPIHRFFDGDQASSQLGELMGQLFKVLQLTPLVDAALPVPPVFVFPSFAASVVKQSTQAQVGVQDLVAQAVSAACGVDLRTIQDVYEFSHAEPDRFVQQVMHAQLFVPDGALPGEIADPRAAAERFLADLGKSRRSGSASTTLARAPLSGVLVAGMLMRFGPQYLLLERASEMAAQPMLVELDDWHFFRKAATAKAQKLHRDDVLSADTLKLLQALQHDRLQWLANIPIPVLAGLLKNQENLAFRKELGEQTKVLTSAGPADLDRVVREVCHAIDSLVQKHQKSIGDIERKYADKYQATWIAGGFTTMLGVAATFLPVLSAFGPAAPAIAIAGAAGKYALDRIAEVQEIRQARSNFVGVLAATTR